MSTCYTHFAPVIHILHLDIPHTRHTFMYTHILHRTHTTLGTRWLAICLGPKYSSLVSLGHFTLTLLTDWTQDLLDTLCVSYGALHFYL